MVRSNSTRPTLEQLQRILLAMIASGVTIWVNLCLPQGYISYELCRQTLKSAKHILLECEPLGKENPWGWANRWWRSRCELWDHDTRTREVPRRWVIGLKLNLGLHNKSILIAGQRAFEAHPTSIKCIKQVHKLSSSLSFSSFKTSSLKILTRKIFPTRLSIVYRLSLDNNI